MKNIFAALFLSLLLAACGGGGGDEPAPTNPTTPESGTGTGSGGDQGTDNDDSDGDQGTDNGDGTESGSGDGDSAPPTGTFTLTLTESNIHGYAGFGRVDVETSPNQRAITAMLPHSAAAQAANVASNESSLAVGITEDNQVEPIVASFTAVDADGNPADLAACNLVAMDPWVIRDLSQGWLLIRATIIEQVHNCDVVHARLVDLLSHVDHGTFELEEGPNFDLEMPINLPNSNRNDTNGALISGWYMTEDKDGPTHHDALWHVTLPTSAEDAPTVALVSPNQSKFNVLLDGHLYTYVDELLKVIEVESGNITGSFPLRSHNALATLNGKTIVSTLFLDPELFGPDMGIIELNPDGTYGEKTLLPLHQQDDVSWTYIDIRQVVGVYADRYVVGESCAIWDTQTGDWSAPTEANNLPWFQEVGIEGVRITDNGVYCTSALHDTESTLFLTKQSYDPLEPVTVYTRPWDSEVGNSIQLNPPMVSFVAKDTNVFDEEITLLNLDTGESETHTWLFDGAKVYNFVPLSQ
ncbi:hypothetical protein [Ferrimonas marina]|uniref:Uncharacterized protein n=1 Tax=Ferrimonas marina TaxID=299255 RepID=A0A1M5U808_9GAMM|nr:hypothetical protein [Ferrimonas marina]SHH58823.1 hypothetical protein SAMN02745129_2436 [Ferrimonas marina]